jgi:hypothetical protein
MTRSRGGAVGGGVRFLLVMAVLIQLAQGQIRGFKFDLLLVMAVHAALL